MRSGRKRGETRREEEREVEGGGDNEREGKERGGRMSGKGVQNSQRRKFGAK